MMQGLVLVTPAIQILYRFSGFSCQFSIPGQNLTLICTLAADLPWLFLLENWGFSDLLGIWRIFISPILEQILLLVDSFFSREFSQFAILFGNSLPSSLPYKCSKNLFQIPWIKILLIKILKIKKIKKYRIFWFLFKDVK